MQPTQRIPFNRSFVTGKEADYVREVLTSGHPSGDGSFSRKCHEWLEKHVGCKRALLTHSGTGALEMAALLLDLEPGDEVIVPSFTFVSTVNAFVLRGAQPVFADIRGDTLNLDEKNFLGLITPRTKAIVAVHYGGVACEMDTILSIADEAKIVVVEDNAHGLLGEYKGRKLGSLGALSAQSFHETKNFSCGEGGALLVNDPSMIERAEIIREKGTNRSRFFRGQVDKYTWQDIGSSFLPSDVQAALLYAQFEAAEEIQSRRRAIWEQYEARLQHWAETNGVQLPMIPDDCMQPYHIFHLLMPTPQARDGLIASLQQKNIAAVFHYLPLHISDMGQKLGGKPGMCPVTESVSERLVRLPLFAGMTDDELERVVSGVCG